MIWLTVAMTVLGALPTILKIVEKLFDGIHDSSDDKKAMAKEMVKTVIKGATEVTGPELDKILLKANELVDPFIDLLCAIMFPKED